MKDIYCNKRKSSQVLLRGFLLVFFKVRSVKLDQVVWREKFTLEEGHNSAGDGPELSDLMFKLTLL